MKTGIFLTAVCAGAAATAGQSIEQISNVPREAETKLDIQGDRRPSALPEQLASDAESSTPTAQVTTERRSSTSPDQLSKDGKTAQQPQPLSHPTDGRRSDVERLAGTDRCDPADAKRSRSRCAKVIENRAAEFARPDPNALSPEQRLLLEQEVREGALDTQTAARRLATTGEAAESLVAMGVAASVIRSGEDSAAPQRPEEDPTKVVADIVGAIINQPLTPQPPQ